MMKALILASLLVAQVAFGEGAQNAGKLTDMAALNIQDHSIRKLESLIKQYSGTSREAELLYRLGDLYLERSGLSFRISEGTSIQKKSPLYSSSLKNAVRVYSALLGKYPYHALAPMAHFKRGKAYKELEDRPHAKLDYLYLDQHAKDFEYLDSALIDLADFAQDANQHQEALTYLSEIEKMPDSDYFPVALHKAAWSYFNLGLHESSIIYLQKEINYYYTKIDANKDGSAPEIAYLDSAFGDLSLFYFEAINKKTPFASIAGAIETFHRLDTHKVYFGKTVLKFAKLLKAYTLTDNLDELRKRLVKNEAKLPETTDVVLLIFQFEFDRRNFKNISPLVADLRALRNEKTEPQIEQTLSGALTELHKLVLKNKMATERAVLVRPLVSLTETVADLLGNGNATALLANYALAETLFELGDFTQATEYYRSILKPEFEATLAAKKLPHADLMLRLIASRYQELKKDSLIPEKLKIQSLTTNVSLASKEQLSQMSEWITWVDSLTEKTVAFDLEAAKLLYVYFDREKAITRLMSLGLAHPETPEAQTAFAIVLDTLTESNVPSRLYATTQTLLAIPKQPNKDFTAKLKDMSAGAHLKVTMDQTKDPKITLERTEECLKKFGTSKVAVECRNIHAKALIELGQYDAAQTELTQLLTSEKDETHLKALLLLRADTRSKLGKTDESIQDLNRYQAITHYADPDITEEILEYSWFQNDHSALRTLLSTPKVCEGKNEGPCDQYKVVLMLEDDKHNVPYLTAFRNTLKAPKEVQSVWALYALQNPKKLAFQDRLTLLDRLAHSWENLNPLLQIHLFPTLVSQITETLDSIAASAPGIAPLSSNPESIERRMRLMQDVDQTFSKVMKLDWMEIKSAGIRDLGIIYTRLVQDLRSIQTPEDLIKPFNQKIADIQKASGNLEAMVVEFHPVPISAAQKVKDKNARSTASIAQATGPLPTAESLLVSDEVKSRLPAHLWNAWVKGVEGKRRDWLFHIVKTAESSTPDLKTFSPILRGLVLLLGGAPTEAYSLIETAPDSPWKSVVTAQFQRRKP